MTISSIKPAIAYQRLAAIKHPLANKFYREVKARGKASGGDLVWVARDMVSDNSAAPIIAVARLTPVIERYWLLTGVYVADNYRHRGIASQLITQLANRQACCYTFALTHLFNFYRRLGFTEVAANDLPCELAQMFKAYRQQGRYIIAMIKQ